MTPGIMTDATTLSPALNRIAPSATTAMTDRAIALRAEGRDIISLSVGEPDFATPPHVVAAAKAALDAGDTKYTAVGGTAALKAAAALHFARDLGLQAGAVTVSAGGKQAIFHALMATLSPGDEVVIPAPWWVSYPEIVRLAGATPVPVACHAATGFRPDLAAIGEAVAAHPRVLVMSDDIYAPLRYTPGDHATLAVVRPDLAERALTVSGVSKSHAMTGFRIGVATGPAWLIAAMERLQSHSSGNPCSISQAAAVAAFEGSQDFLADWRARFIARRDACVAAINAIPGLTTPVPEGAFYCMIDAAGVLPRFGGDDTALALHLLEHGVAVVAASAFGAGHCGFGGFRISFAADDARLAEAMSRIAGAFA